MALAVGLSLSLIAQLEVEDDSNKEKRENLPERHEF